MKVLLVVLAIVAIVSADEVSDRFQEFMATYNKQYDSAKEQKLRFEIFQFNYEKIQWLKSTAKGVTYGVTKFADLSPDEFASKYLTYNRPAVHISNKYPGRRETEVSLASSFDWRDKGAVTPVKNQEQCGSCWAFSATEAIESQWFLSGHTLPVLSEQQIVDCDTTDDGCGGGDTTTAYQYVISAGGIETEAAYPYTAEDGQCTFNKASVDATIDNWEYITQNKNETEMQVKMVSAGPLSVCVDAVTWQFYIEGVIAWGDLCYDSLDHCVMITGYNDQYDGYKVWNVRNSWGTDWGEEGYIFIERGYDLCGIAEEVTIPLVQ